MNLFQLFNNLDANLQEKIRILYLGFGTPTANLVKGKNATINNIKLMLQNKAVYSSNIEDLTAWRFKIICRPVPKITTHVSNQSSLFAKCDLELAYNKSTLCKDSSMVRNMRIEIATRANAVKFRMKYAALTEPPKHATACAIIIKGLIKTMDNGGTLWNARVRQSGGRIMDHKCSELMLGKCPPDVYNELLLARNI